MPTPRKEQEVALLEAKFKQATGMVFTDYLGLTANEMVELRRQLREHGLEYRVIKNRLARLAAQRAGVAAVEPFIEGPTGICFGFDDPTVPFKLVDRLAKQFDKYEPRGGVFEGEPVAAEELARLARLPSREEALTRLAAVVQAPAQKLAAALAGPVRNLAVVLREVSQHKQ